MRPLMGKSGSINSGAFNNPSSVAFSASGAYAYVVNNNANNVVIINTASNTVTGSITSSFNEPSGVSISPSGTYACPAGHRLINRFGYLLSSNSAPANILLC